jgi:hypothetical protein
MTKASKGRRGSSTTATLNVSPTIPRQVVFQKVGDEVILLNLGTGIYYGLNTTGARIWELLAEKRDLKGVLRSMTREYKADAGTLRRGLLRLVRELKAKGLIEVAKP